ncbi:MAG: ATP-grasp domain-containing protein [Thermodesulfobacteriota bacterium]|nr:ATP-grasp domain-containing protein [Thermodesulfobacteriota bacterium]
MNPIRILVTGAGSGVGQGIVKALRASFLPLKIISSDIAALNSALFRTDEALLLPKVEDEGSLEVIVDGIRKARIDVVMIGSEFDLCFFAEHKEIIEAETGALVVVSPRKTVEVAEDKWLTAEFLRENNLPYAPAYVPEGTHEALEIAAAWGYPLIFKTRTGTSSRHIHVVENEERMLFLFDTVPNPMLQQMINTPEKSLGHEYTCSVFRCRDGSILGPFTARRTLRGGNSWVVEVARFEELHPLLLGIGEMLPAMGALNIQLMMGPGGPVPFEFNARFSGTTAVRAHFGFNEPEMAIRNYFLGDELERPVIRHGLAFRYLEEVFVDNAAADKAEKFFTQGMVRTWF